MSALEKCTLLYIKWAYNIDFYTCFYEIPCVSFLYNWLLQIVKGRNDWQITSSSVSIVKHSDNKKKEIFVLKLFNGYNAIHVSFSWVYFPW